VLGCSDGTAARRVFVIDDDPLSGEVLPDFLAAAGFEVERSSPERRFWSAGASGIMPFVDVRMPG